MGERLCAGGQGPGLFLKGEAGDIGLRVEALLFGGACPVALWLLRAPGWIEGGSVAPSAIQCSGPLAYAQPLQVARCPSVDLMQGVLGAAAQPPRAPGAAPLSRTAGPEPGKASRDASVGLLSSGSGIRDPGNF